MTEPVQPAGTIPPPPPPPQPPVEPKKKTSPLLWVAIGCAAIVVLGFVVVIGGGIFAAKKAVDYVEAVADDPTAAAMMVAENIVRLNPDLELVDSDRESQTLTIRNKDTGEVMTLDLEDVEQGRIGFEGDEGEYSIGVDPDSEDAQFSIKKDGEETFSIGASNTEKIPDWLPIFPDSEVEGVFSMKSEGTANGAFTLKTSASVEELLSFYESHFEETEGWEASRTDFSSGDLQGGHVSLSNSESNLSMSVNATSSDDGAQAAINYSSSE